MLQTLPNSRDSNSQTAGPYVAIGLAPGGAGRMQFVRYGLWPVAHGTNIGPKTQNSAPKEETAVASDPVLNSVDTSAQSKTLIAIRTAPGSDRCHIRLPGNGETVIEV